MPNWCGNRLTVLGETDDIFAFCRRAARPTARYAIPAPASCAPIPTTSDCNAAGPEVRPKSMRTALQWEPRPPATPLSLHALVPVPLRVRRRGFAAAGYDWQRAHWGVKWDVDGGVTRRAVPGGVEFDFRSPWGPPARWFVEVVRRFTSLHLTLRYHEPNMCFAGTMVGDGGRLQEDTELTNPSDVDDFAADLFAVVWYGEPGIGADPLPDWRRVRAPRRRRATSPLQLRLEFADGTTA